MLKLIHVCITERPHSSYIYDRPYAKDLVMFVFLAAGIMNLFRQYPEAIRLMDDQASASGNGSLK